MNGTDIQFWFFLITLIPSFVAIVALIYTSILFFINRKPGTWILIAIQIPIVVVIIWATFGAYGKGISTELAPVEEEGINKRMERTGEEDLDKAKKSSENKVHDTVKEVRENLQGGPGPEKISEDEKFQKTLEDALRVKNNMRRQ